MATQDKIMHDIADISLFVKDYVKEHITELCKTDVGYGFVLNNEDNDQQSLEIWEHEDCVRLTVFLRIKDQDTYNMMKEQSKLVELKELKEEIEKKQKLLEEQCKNSSAASAAE